MRPTKRPARLEPAARELKALIGRGGFVRRDIHRRALFISDYPARLPQAEAQTLTKQLKQAGWLTSPAGGLMLLDWGFSRYQAFFDSLPQPAAAEDGLYRLYARHPIAFEPPMLGEAREALLLWDEGKMDALKTLAGAALAVALRKKETPPAFYPALLSEGF